MRDVPVTVVGTCDYTTSGPVQDPAGLDNHVRQRLMQAISQVVGQQMYAGQLQFRNLGEGNLGPALGEIINASQLSQWGVQIVNLSLAFGIDGRQPQQPRAQPQQQQPQLNVKAKINVGGFKINASTDKGLDTAGLMNQAKDKAKSNLIWYGVGCGILLVVVLGVLGLGLYIWRSAATASVGGAGGAAAAGKWDGKSTFTCGGNDNVTLSGVTANLTTTAISANMNCHLALSNVKITAPTGIDASGNAVVTVTGGSITSTTLAAHADINAQITFTGTTVSGKTQAEMNGKITGP
jgi:hypothetical protein